MIPAKHIPTILKQVVRHRTRTTLTVAGVAVAMFLFVAVQSLRDGVHAATQSASSDTKLVVYRQNRFCPATSRLPENYGDRIERIAGVAEVVPMKVVVNNCGASLDVVTFRGVPEDSLPLISKSWLVLEGSIDEWNRRSDSALVGARLAERRGIRVGQSFDAAGVTVNVAGIIESDEAQDQNVAYVHLPFLQQAAKGSTLGIVTQFAVRVTDSSQLDSVAKQIDEEFKTDQEPTQTRPEKAFVAQAASDVIAIVGFTRYLGWACLAAVLALVANSIILSVRDRVKEHAVLQTLGYRPGLLARLVVVESVILSLLGGLVGTGLALVVVRFGQFTLSNEGLSIPITARPGLVALGLGISIVVGVLAGLVPAFSAGRRDLATCFRAV
ncbi:MAG: ABC transporter permease [Phycisphaerales bacterium]